MTEPTYALHRTLRATLAATAVAAVTVVGVACAPIASQKEGPSMPANSESSSDADVAAADDSAETDAASDAGASDSESGESSDASENTQAAAGGPGGKQLLEETMSGQEAIDALGDDIDIVAKRAGKSVDELKELLLKNKSAHVSKTGDLFYKDTLKN